MGLREAGLRKHGHFVDLGEHRHWYLDEGDPAAPAIVLLHDGAFGSDALSCWEPVLDALSGSHRVVAPDLTGYGRSPKVFDFAVDARTQRLRAVTHLLGSIGIDRFAVVGASFGASLALQAAFSGELDLTACVAISGTGGLFMSGPGFDVLNSYLPGEPVDELTRLLMKHPPAGELERRRLAASELPHWRALKAPGLAPANLPRTPPSDRESRHRASLASISVPTLFLGGADDELMTPGWERGMAELVPGARAVTIDDARHFPQVDNPVATADAILAFIDECEGRVSAQSRHHQSS